MSDERGNLCFAENSELPFKVERVFWIANVPDGKTRGGHAHQTCAEIIFPVSGAFDIYVCDEDGERVVRMDRPDTGIYIGPNVWCELRNFEPGTVCLVLASHPYSAQGYINDFKQFKSR
ncbi:MAG: FdtA/QdtA family cupin domain-containing protein [Bacteroidaceae bacterium]|nr:FdtA/QdtA family cupin domain-containing protein [Bacteroidaceae bacterium]